MRRRPEIIVVLSILSASAMKFTLLNELTRRIWSWSNMSVTSLVFRIGRISAVAVRRHKSPKRLP